MPPVIAVLPVIAKVAITVGLIVATYLLTPKPKAFRSAARSQLSTGTNPVAPWRVIYGRTRVGGTVVFQHRAAGVLYMVIVVACHRVADIEEVYANDNDFSGNMTAWDAGATNGSERVGTGSFSGKFKIRKYLGTQTTTDAGITAAAPTKWTAAGGGNKEHALRGRAYVAIEMEDDNELWKGLPRWTFLVKGKDDIFDPRTDTYIWTPNAALCQADYLYNDAFGYGAGTISGNEYTKIEDADLVTAANICDESVSVLPSGTENRYEINGAFDVDNDHEAIMGHLLTASAGRALKTAGKWRIFAGAHVASVGTITETDLAGRVQILATASRAELFNRVKGVHPSSAEDYLPTDYPPVENATYQTDDGGVLPTDLDLPFTVSNSAAQRLAKIELEDGRQQLTVQLRCNLAAYRYLPWDRVDVTLDRYSWSSKTFRVLESRLVIEDAGGGPALFVDLTLKETAASVYTWSLEETEVAAPPPTDVLDPTAPPPAPTSLVFAENNRTTFAGIILAFVKVSWTAPTNTENVDHYEVRWRQGTGLWKQHHVEVDRLDQVIGPIQDNAATPVEVYSVSPDGVKSTALTGTHNHSNQTPDYTGNIGGSGDAAADIVGDVTGTIAAPGELKPGVLNQDDAGNAAPPARGVQHGTGQDGTAVTYDPPYATNPDVQLAPLNMKTSDSGTLSGSQKVILQAVDQTPNGFTIKARVAEMTGGTTNRSVAFSGTIDQDGEQLDVTKTQTPEAVDDAYTFKYDITLDAASSPFPPAIGVLSFWTKPSGGSWTQRATKQHVNTDTGSGKTFSNQTVTVVVDGLGANAEFRIEVENDAGISTNGVSGDTVSWEEATAPTDVTATPDNDNMVAWTATEVE